MREFDTGATRDSDDGKLDYEGFLSPSALKRYAEYMNKNRKQADGKLRASDNWQKGIPKAVYMKSLFRHFMEVWTIHRSADYSSDELCEALCAMLFNVFGYLHEELRDRMPCPPTKEVQIVGGTHWHVRTAPKEASTPVTPPPVSPEQAGFHDLAPYAGDGKTGLCNLSEHLEKRECTSKGGKQGCWQAYACDGCVHYKKPEKPSNQNPCDHPTCSGLSCSDCGFNRENK